MVRLRFIELMTALLLAACLPWPADAGMVRAEDHSSFWLWGGVRSQPALARADNLYILQGQVVEVGKGNRSKVVVIPQGMPVARVKTGRTWLVYRATTIRWTPDIMASLVARLHRWQLSGNDVAGLQIDFDAGTKHLQEYAEFLRQVRVALPATFQLGITGLLDWSSNGDAAALDRLKEVVDEITIQTYQGRTTIANYQSYLPALMRLTIPFKIGLIQNGEWEAPTDVGSSPWFRGYVVFLQNEKKPGRGSVHN
jgi:hypothetical protein